MGPPKPSLLYNVRGRPQAIHLVSFQAITSHELHEVGENYVNACTSTTFRDSAFRRAVHPLYHLHNTKAVIFLNIQLPDVIPSMYVSACQASMAHSMKVAPPSSRNVMIGTEFKPLIAKKLQGNVSKHTTRNDALRIQ